MNESHDEAPDGDWIRRLQDLRRLMGWSQRRLAKELRVTPGAVSQWESGQRGIPGPVRRLVEIYEERLGMVDGPQGPGFTRINGSWSARSLRASTTTARATAALAGSSLRGLLVSNARATEIQVATRQAIAMHVADTLGEMKGVLMKLGQMASYLEFVGSPEFRQALQCLQDRTPPMSAAAVRGVFLESLGDTPAHLFRDWQARPFAAASIGQVHAAQLADGTPVAVKVQYPGIREAIASDLKNVAALERLAGLLLRNQEPGALVAELRERLLEECDYRREAENHELFRRLYQDVAGVFIPPVFPEVSSDRILTTGFVAGRSFAAFVEQADQASKDRAGEIIARVAFDSIYKHGIFNADPHPGNYLFPEGGGVAFLDFGCVKRFSRGTLKHWAAYGRAVLEDRRDEADATLVAMGFVPDRERFDFAYQHAMMRLIYAPWHSERPFRFNQHYVERTWTSSVNDNPNLTRINMPAEALLMNRLQWGLHSVLAALEAQADWRAIYVESIAACL